MRKSINILLLLLVFTSGYAGKNIPVIPGLSASPETGLISLSSNIKVGLYFSGPNHIHGRQTYGKQFSLTATSLAQGEEGIGFKGKWRVGSAFFDFKEQLKKREDGSVDCRWQVSNTAGIRLNYLWLTVTLPAEYEGKKIVLGDKELALSELGTETQNLTSFKVRNIMIPCKAGKIVITGKRLDGMVIAAGVTPEKRLKYGKYVIRINCSVSKGLIKESGVGINIKTAQLSSEPIDISQSANTSFTDEVDGDRKGGWTDQGHNKDMRSLTPGNIPGDIEFTILDPNCNRGKSCIVLKGDARTYFPVSAVLPMNGKKFRRLYLLHAAAWEGGKKELAGNIKVIYQDASNDNFTVTNMIDVGGWSRNVSLPNAIPAWSGRSDAIPQVTLYRSSFRLKDKKIRDITFIGGNKPVWMIAAVSGSNDLLEPPVDNTQSVTYRAGRNWIAVNWPQHSPEGAIIKGSALDFSDPTTAPAGKFGKVICSGNNFIFEKKKDTKVRFFSCSLTQRIPFPDKKQAEVFADYLAATGHNAVRFHCCWRQDMLKSDGSPNLNPLGLDKFCYFLHCLKQRGIYYYFPINANNHTKIHDPEFPGIAFEGKEDAPISNIAMKWLQDFAGNLLRHINPYTGIAIKDDPALIGIELINEDNLYHATSNKAMMKIYKLRCTEYLRSKQGKQPDEADVKKFMPEFMVLMQQKIVSNLKNYLHNIGVDKPVTDVSISNQIPLALTREKLDFVDIHAYWDLYKSLPGKKPGVFFKHKIHMVNPLEGKWNTQFHSGAARLFGKPFAMGEYNSCYPSPFWSYMGPANAVIAGIQNWSLISLYAIELGYRPLPVTRLTAYNPVSMTAQRIGAMMYKNNEVQESAIKIPYVVTRQYIMKNLDMNGNPRIPDNYFVLGLCCQIGLIIYDKNIDWSQYACAVIPKDMKIPEGLKNTMCIVADSSLHEKMKKLLPGLKSQTYTSSNGQTTLDVSQKTFSIVTPKAECFMLPDTKAGIQGNSVSVSENKLISTCFVGSLDQRSLEQSKRLLVLYITDLKNTNSVVKYPQYGGAVLEINGTLPFLLRQGDCEFSIKTTHADLPRIWALKYNGSREKVIVPRKTMDGFAFTVKAVTSKNAYFAYEICW